jgi:hypothetical protein
MLSPTTSSPIPLPVHEVESLLCLLSYTSQNTKLARIQPQQCSEQTTAICHSCTIFVSVHWNYYALANENLSFLTYSSLGLATKPDMP